MTVRVSGGADSIAADFDHLDRLALGLDALARQCGVAAMAVLSSSSDPALVTAAVLDPGGALDVATIAAAILFRLTALGAEAETLAIAIRAAAAGYRVTDDLAGRYGPELSALAHGPGAIVAALPGLAAATGDLAHGRFAAAGKDLVATGQQVVTGDPALADLILLGIAGESTPGPAIAPRSRSPVTNSAAALAACYHDGTPILTRRPHDPTIDQAGPPRGAADLIDGLAVRNHHNDGGVDVRFVATTHPDGTVTRAAIVDITGTKTWGPFQRDNPNITSLVTNLRTVGNEVSAYELGVLLAMRDAGIRPGEPIMLVGHSQGGIVAAQLAVHLAGSSQYCVTHLVTAGAPIGRVPVPRGVSTLSLENRGDVVPHVDGASNPRRPNWTTVAVHDGPPTVGGQHGLESGYLPGAREADASTDPSLAAWRSGASAFLSGDQVTTTVYNVARKP